MPQNEFTVTRWKSSRFYALYSPGGQLIAVTTYRKGSENIARIFNLIAKYINLSEDLFTEPQA